MSPSRIGVILVILTVIPYCYGRQGPQLSDPETISRIEEMLLTQQRQISELTETVSVQNEELVVQRKQISKLTKTVSEQNGELVVQKRQINEQKSEIMFLKQKIGGLERRTGYLSNRAMQCLCGLQGFNSGDTTVKSKNTVRYRTKEDRKKKTEKSKRLLVGNENGKTKIGFYAYITARELIGQHKIMVFNVVETNVGKAYHNHTGSFIAPVTGLYAFSCALFPYHLSIGTFHLMQNGRIVSTMTADSDGSNFDVSASSITVVLFLQQGDDVYLRSSEMSIRQNKGDLAGIPSARSSFSGWLISE